MEENLELLQKQIKNMDKDYEILRVPCPPSLIWEINGDSELGEAIKVCFGGGGGGREGGRKGGGEVEEGGGGILMVCQSWEKLSRYVLEGGEGGGRGREGGEGREVGRFCFWSICLDALTYVYHYDIIISTIIIIIIIITIITITTIMIIIIII